MSSEKNIEAFVAFVDQLFWNEWDPIGVNLLGGENDEYSRYAHVVASMAWNQPDAATILNYMFVSQTETMGLDITRAMSDAHNKPIVEKILLKRALYKSE